MLEQLFSVCNYYWMLAEGCYIYFLLVLTFLQGRTLFVVCHLIGWGALPALPSLRCCLHILLSSAF